MGKSLNGKELGKGISQRKDGLYQARFVNRFGKRKTIYAKMLNEIWMNTCKKNCRSSTKETYAGHYRRIQKELGRI